MTNSFSGTDYLKSYAASKALAEKIKEYYKHQPCYDKIEINVYNNPVGGYYYIRSNIASLMPNIVDLEDRLQYK